MGVVWWVGVSRATDSGEHASRVAGWLDEGGWRSMCHAQQRQRAENPVVSSEVRCSCFVCSI